MNDLIMSIRSKAALLKAAIEAYQTAKDKHSKAWGRWNAETIHTEEASHAIAATEETVDVTQDEVISKAQALVYTATLYMRLNDMGTCGRLVQVTASMQSALDREVNAFTAYSKHGMEAHEAWTKEKEACVKAAVALMTEAIVLPYQGDQNPTEEVPQIRIDEPAAWKAGQTPDEQRRLMYEARKETLGTKAAGRMTYGRMRRD